MPERVGSWLPVVVVWGWDPFGVAVGVFAGAPAAGLDDAVLGAAAQGQVVDVGAAAGGVAGDVVDLAVVAGHGAPGCGAATILGMKV